jgi:hypothetical protein
MSIYGQAGTGSPVDFNQGTIMTKTSDTPATDAPKTDDQTAAATTTTPPQSEAEKLTATLASQFKPPVGVAAGVEFLRKHFDEGAHVLTSGKGAKGSRVAEVSTVLVEIDGVRRVVEIHGFESGAFKLFAEVPGRGDAAIAGWLSGMYAAEPQS